MELEKERGRSEERVAKDKSTERKEGEAKRNREACLKLKPGFITEIGFSYVHYFYHLNILVGN